MSRTLLGRYYLTEHTQALQKVGIASTFSSHVDTPGHRKVTKSIHKHKCMKLLIGLELKPHGPREFFTSLKTKLLHEHQGRHFMGLDLGYDGCGDGLAMWLDGPQ